MLFLLYSLLFALVSDCKITQNNRTGKKKYHFSNLVLDKVLGVKDLRTDKRIDFVGGIRGLGELKRRMDNGEMKVAFALYAISMKQIIDIADTGNIMPLKTTWFEPKLLSDLVFHGLY